MNETDLLLVNRNGRDYALPATKIEDLTDDADLLVVNRNGVDYKVTAQDLKDYIYPSSPLQINTPVEWEFNAANVPVVTKDATTKGGTAPISMVESIEYEIDQNLIVEPIPMTAVEMNYFAPQDIFVSPYGTRGSTYSNNEGIAHFTMENNTFSTIYSHPSRGSCRHGSFLAKSREHEYVGVLFSRDSMEMGSDAALHVINENGDQKIYSVSELPTYNVPSISAKPLPTRFFFKTVGNDEYMYISWYCQVKDANFEPIYISRTRNPVQFDSQGFPIFPILLTDWIHKKQPTFDGENDGLKGIVMGGKYHQAEETLYTMVREAILAYKINESGDIEDAIVYQTRGLSYASARIVVTKNYIIKTIVQENGTVAALTCINKSTGVETNLDRDHVHVATADESKIFRLRRNQVIQYMDYENTGSPSESSTWQEYGPANGQTSPDEDLGGYGSVKESPFTLIWDTQDPDNELNVWGSKPLSGSEACVIQTFTDSIGDTCDSTECKIIP